MFMDKEQGDKKDKIRFVSSKPLARDDMFEISMPVVGVEKNRFERNVAELQGDDLSPEISYDKFGALKDQNKFWHPVPRLMMLNGLNSRNVSLKQFLCILENFFLNNLQVLAEWLQLAPKVYNLLVYDVCIYFGEKSSPYQ
jgi:hypothetical protein